MRHQNPSFACCATFKDMGEYGLSNMCIKCRKGILATSRRQISFVMRTKRTNVEDHDIRVAVYSPTDVDSLFLTTGKRYTSFANLGQIIGGKHLQIWFQTRITDSLPISVLLEWPSETDIISDCSILE